ncbi:hypothetical protein, partial [Cupriavidus sp. AcVe19-6a]|uniref:hypothetical protein n=1 Tax=Cupriavidus sp. AcVe19-6a TaxID=2821358 RepID=UPI001AE7A2A3
MEQECWGTRNAAGKQRGLGAGAVDDDEKTKAKTPRSTRCRGVLHNKSLAMTYFHTGIRTIIG